MIKIVNGILLRNQSAYVKDADKRWVPLHRRQGDLDGACAVYCVIMRLLHIGYLSEENDLKIYNSADKRTPKGKFLRQLMENNGFIRNGYSYVVLNREINNLCGCDLLAQRFNPKEQDDIVNKIVKLLDEDVASIISISWGEGNDYGAHAMLAIGYAKDENNAVTNIFCLDPDAEAPKVSAWNCSIDVSKMVKGTEPYKCVSISNSGYMKTC